MRKSGGKGTHEEGEMENEPSQGKYSNGWMINRYSQLCKTEQIEAKFL